jgi:hypothetical protein
MEIHYTDIIKAYSSPLLGPRVDGIAFEYFKRILEDMQEHRFYAASVQKCDGEPDESKSEEAYYSWRTGVETNLIQSLLNSEEAFPHVGNNE